MNQPHFNQEEKVIICEIIDKQGDKLKNGVILMKNRGRSDSDIVKTLAKLPKMKSLPGFKIKWLALKIHTNSPAAVKAQVKESDTPKTLNLLKKPEKVENIFEWFVNNHENQIQNFLSKGGTIKEITKKFNQAYNPGAETEFGRETLRKRIKTKQMLKSSIQWMEEQKTLIKKIKEGESAKSLFEEAQERGFTGSLRLFQMRIKAVKENLERPQKTLEGN